MGGGEIPIAARNTRERGKRNTREERNGGGENARYNHFTRSTYAVKMLIKFPLPIISDCCTVTLALKIIKKHTHTQKPRNNYVSKRTQFIVDQ